MIFIAEECPHVITKGSQLMRFLSPTTLVTEMVFISIKQGQASLFLSLNLRGRGLMNNESMSNATEPKLQT